MRLSNLSTRSSAPFSRLVARKKRRYGRWRSEHSVAFDESFSPKCNKPFLFTLLKVQIYHSSHPTPKSEAKSWTAVPHTRRVSPSRTRPPENPGPTVPYHRAPYPHLPHPPDEPTSGPARTPSRYEQAAAGAQPAGKSPHRGPPTQLGAPRGGATSSPRCPEATFRPGKGEVLPRSQHRPGICAQKLGPGHTAWHLAQVVHRPDRRRPS